MFIYLGPQVSRIAAAFSLQPPIYLVKDYDNSVIFPAEGSGKFLASSLSAGSLYEVHGTEPAQESNPVTILSQQSQSPYGAYPYQSGSHPQQMPSAPLPHPPPRFKQRAIKKTILIANLSSRDPNRPSSSRASRLVHTVVTQVIINLDSNDCNVTRATESVRKQIGLDVVLLDSKLFPIMDNETTSGPEFWRSTRKIIAVSRASYEKLTGIAVGEELGQVEDDVLNQPPCKRLKEMGKHNFTEDFEALNKKIDAMGGKLSLIDNVVDIVKKIFECVICKSVVKSPVVSKCCQRIIGCRLCVMTWRGTSTRCPLCSVSDRLGDTLELKGFDEITCLLRAGDRENEASTVAVDAGDSSDDDFEDLPNFAVPTSRSS